jgi:hypothetical protein
MDDDLRIFLIVLRNEKCKKIMSLETYSGIKRNTLSLLVEHTKISNSELVVYCLELQILRNIDSDLLHISTKPQ